MAYQSQPNALAIAIMKAIGVDHSTVRALSFSSRVGEEEIVTVEHHIWNADTHTFDDFTQKWQPVPEEKP